jgi:peptide deformylase
MKIVTTPHPVLNAKAKPIYKFDASLKKIADDMVKVLVAQNDPPGVGLAAPQVGLSIQFFVIKIYSKDKPMFFANPKIIEIKDKKGKKKLDTSKLEGCLSISKIWGPVQRHSRILVEYQDLEGNKLTEWFAGFKSVVIQHEIDHLEGILFTQRIIEQKGILYEEKHGELHRIKDIL